MHPVLAGFLLRVRKKSDSEPGVIAGHERDAAVLASWQSSVISQPRTPAQKGARRSGSFASKQSAKRSESSASPIRWLTAADRARPLPSGKQR